MEIGNSDLPANRRGSLKKGTNRENTLFTCCPLEGVQRSKIKRPTGKMIHQALRQLNANLPRQKQKQKSSSSCFEPRPEVEDATDEEIWKYYCRESNKGLIEMTPEHRTEIPLLRQFLINREKGCGYEVIQDQLPKIGLGKSQILKARRSPDDDKMYMDLANMALESDEEFSVYRVQKLVNVNVITPSCDVYYLTFTATKQDDQLDFTEDFNAIVMPVNKYGNEEVIVCKRRLY